MADFEILIKDESHLAAHADDLYLSRQDALNLIRKELTSYPREGEVRGVLKHTKPVGVTGLETLSPREDKSFWAYRKGRAIPSHLVYGRKKSTRHLAFWGQWRDPRSFVLSTFYPGKIAPREPHDPGIALAELKESVRFWAHHAIVVEPGQLESE